MWKEYITVASLEQAIRLIGESPGDMKIIAGATDLMLELENDFHPAISRLIDISRVPDLDRITMDSGWIHLGPLVTHNHCAGSPIIQEHAFALAKACWEVGSPQIRNRGTIVGNLITASPANDSIPPLMALGAQVTLKSIESERTVPLDEFYTGVRKTVLKPGEVVSDVAFPVPGSNATSTFTKVALRRAQAIAIVNIAIKVEFDGARVIDAKITMGSVAPTVIHANLAEQFLKGKSITVEIADEAGGLASRDAKPIDDLRGSANYRSEIVRVSVRRGLLGLAEGSEQADYPEKQVMLWGKYEGQLKEGIVSKFEHNNKEEIHTTINGKEYQFATGQNKSLLRLLREEAFLTGSKEGCAEGECGACTVFLDDIAVMACLVPAPRAHHANIVTIEGVGREDRLHPLQETFISEGAVQCGYCTPGFIMSGVKLLEEVPHPSKEEIEQSITGNLCRCTGYYKIVTAFEQAAARYE
jgi:carbon-monoxide dehydrogenase medium subunit